MPEEEDDGGDSRRAASEALAKRLDHPDDAEVRLARRDAEAWLAGGTAAVAGPPAAAGARMPPPPWPIGIWQVADDAQEPRLRTAGAAGDGAGQRVWRRPPPLLLGDHHATRRELRPKTAPLPLRVVLFGESAAAGYLYAPYLTPALVLERQLRAVGGEGAFEVIDLARTNEGIAPLVDTVGATLQINPDVLVIFAGNNWNLLETPSVSPYAASPAAKRLYAAALEEGGLAGPAALAAAQLRSTVEAAFAAVARMAREVGIPVVIVVPEVNLADWENRQPPPWLAGDGNDRWHRLYRQALRRLEARQWTAAAVAARAMLRLDGGCCSTSHRLLARAELGQGRSAAALAACRAEVDAAAYATLCFLGAPQATTAAQELLREAARRHGFACVDLPRVFAEHTGDELPGRRLLLDYCHLTVEGMHVAMAAVAAEVMRFSGMFEGDEDWRSLLLRLPLPVVPAAADATAKLGAALHGAHRLLAVGPKRSILEHWCRQALAASPSIADAMLNVAAARLALALAPVPAVLSAAQQRILASPHLLQHQHGWCWDFLDAEVLLAFESALADAEPPAATELRRLLRTAATPRGARADLTRAPYLWEPLERFYPDAMESAAAPQRATLRAPWPESSFCLLADGESDLVLELTARLPAVPDGGIRRGRTAVRVNGARIGSCVTARGWSRATVHVPRQRLRPGLNRLTLEWPMLPTARGLGESAVAMAVTRLRLGLDAELHPVFGEIYSLLVLSP